MSERNNIRAANATDASSSNEGPSAGQSASGGSQQSTSNINPAGKASNNPGETDDDDDAPPQHEAAEDVKYGATQSPALQRFLQEERNESPWRWSCDLQDTEVRSGHSQSSAQTPSSSLEQERVQESSIRSDDEKESTSNDPAQSSKPEESEITDITEDA